MAGWGNSRWGNSPWSLGDVAEVLYAKLQAIPLLIAHKVGITALFSGKAAITVLANEKALSVTSMDFKNNSINPVLQATSIVVGSLQIKSFTITPLT